jgi:uncharacterized protein
MLRSRWSLRASPHFHLCRYGENIIYVRTLGRHFKGIKMKINNFIIVPLLSILLISCISDNKVLLNTFPKFHGYINDNYKLLSDEQSKDLSLIMNNIFLKNNIQMSILIIDSTHNLSIEEYSLKICKLWGLGGKNTDKGILFLFAMEDKKLRLEVSSELETILPDDKCQKIVDSIIHFFKQKNYYNGIYDEVLQVSNIIQNDIK